MKRTIEVSEETYESIKDQLGESSDIQEGETFSIAVLDKGFVYVGYCKTGACFLHIRKPRNIRKWGTTDGLGELSLKGPLADTVLDVCRDITAPIAVLIHMIACEESQWH